MSVPELRDIGVSRMDEAEIGRFLSSQATGVLGLPTGGAPYLLPMSFGYDGNSTLYFAYVLGSDSRKERLSEAADGATFLVYKADGPFHWESVLLSGTVGIVPDDGREAAEAAMETAWRPDLLANADLSGGVGLYRFRIEDRVGLKHTGLPPGFEG